MYGVVTVFILYRILNRTSPSAALPYPEHAELFQIYTPVYILYIYDHSFFYSVRSFFRLGLSMGCSELEFLGQIASFERLSSGGGSNAPRPALSVRHLDVNANGC